MTQNIDLGRFCLDFVKDTNSDTSPSQAIILSYILNYRAIEADSSIFRNDS